MKYFYLISLMTAMSILPFYAYCTYWEPSSYDSNTPVVCLFAHGLFDNGSQAQNYSKTYTKKGEMLYNEQYLFECPVISFDFPDASSYIPWIKPAYCCVGQDDDIACLKQAYENCLEQNRNTRIILMGVSRGASTVLNFVATHKPSNIAALILESPFDSLENVIQNTPVIKHEWISYFFKKYDCNGIQPIHHIKHIDFSIPTLFIYSRADQRVPYESTYTLYEVLKQTGHQNVHVCTLTKSKHAKLFCGSEKNIYQKAVHTFLKRYNLPCNTFFTL